jgi:hypothetical protein
MQWTAHSRRLWIRQIALRVIPISTDALCHFEKITAIIDLCEKQPLSDDVERLNQEIEQMSWPIAS